MLLFNGEEEKSLRRLLKCLAEWYQSAPKLQGNLGLIARVERDLPVVFGKIKEELPFNVPLITEASIRPTELPRWEDNEGEGEGFYYYGEPFLLVRADRRGKPRPENIGTGGKLPFSMFSKEKEKDVNMDPDDFVKNNWQQWIDADLLSQKQLRGGKGEEGLDPGPMRAMVNKHRPVRGGGGAAHINTVVPSDHKRKRKIIKSVFDHSGQNDALKSCLLYTSPSPRD